MEAGRYPGLGLREKKKNVSWAGSLGKLQMPGDFCPYGLFSRPLKTHLLVMRDPPWFC